jgi:hypothetical protein
MYTAPVQILISIVLCVKDSNTFISGVSVHTINNYHFILVHSQSIFNASYLIDYENYIKCPLNLERTSCRFDNARWVYSTNSERLSFKRKVKKKFNVQRNIKKEYEDCRYLHCLCRKCCVIYMLTFNAQKNKIILLQYILSSV